MGLWAAAGDKTIRDIAAIIAIAFVVAACGESAANMSLTTPPPAPPLPSKAWMVSFDTNSTALSRQANTTVGEAATVATASHLNQSR